MKRVRVHEFFRDFDKLRKGKVTCGQFKTILSMLNFQMTDEEFDSLTETYKTSDSMFNSKDFCDAVNSSFTQHGIDKNPEARVQAMSSQDTMQARRKYLEANDGEDGQVREILEAYRKEI